MASPFGSFGETYCQKFGVELDGTIKALEAMEVLLKGPIKILKRLIAPLLESNSGDITDGLSGLDQAVSQTIPQSDEFDQLVDAGNACALIDQELKSGGTASISHSLGSGLASAMIVAINKIKDQLINDYLEYPIAQSIDEINKKLEKAKLKDLFDRADQIMQCSESVCAGSEVDLASKYDTIQSLKHDLYINDEGLLNHGRVIQDVGVAEGKVPDIVFVSNVSNFVTELKKGGETAAQDEMKDLMDQAGDLFK